MSSTLVLFLALKKLNADVYWMVPHRVKTGYGMHNSTIDFAYENNIDLIITVDNGIAAKEQIEYAKSLDIEVIVTDHHEPKIDESKNLILPDCLIIDPKCDKSYNFNGLCGAGVAYKVILALFQYYNLNDDESKNFLKELEIFVMIGTIADVMDVIDENRTIIISGLNNIKKTKNIGLKKLLQLTKLYDKKITPTDIGFTLGPCINAAGRLDTAELAVELFLCDDEVTAEKLAKKIISYNEERKEIQNNIVKTINIDEKDNLIVYQNDNLGHGLLGIIAEKLKNTYGKPCFIFGKKQEDNKISGSGRTYSDFSIIDCVTLNQDIASGGGHKAACGLSINNDNFDVFKERCNKIYSEWLIQNSITNVEPQINITCEVNLEFINERLLNNINKLEPFGPKNEEPIFVTKNVEVIKKKIVGKYKNVIQFTFLQNFESIAGIGFEELKNQYDAIGQPDNVDIVYTIGLNEWPQGVFNIQLLIKDIRKSEE